MERVVKIRRIGEFNEQLASVGKGNREMTCVCLA